MTQNHIDITDEQEEAFRAIAREEAEAVTDEHVTDGDGESWSLGDLVHDVGLTRRQALLAMFYMAGGAVASTAIVQAFSETAEAAPSDDLTVPGTLDAGSVDTGSALIGEHEQINGIESGTLTHNHSATADDTWGSADSITTSVSFSTAFSSAPDVAFATATNADLTTSTQNISTTGMDVGSKFFRSYEPSGITIHWVAISVD